MEDKVCFMRVCFIKLNEKFRREKHSTNVDPHQYFRLAKIKFYLQNSPSSEIICSAT